MDRRRILIVSWVLVLGLSSLIPLTAFFRGIVHLGHSPLVYRVLLRKPVISIGRDVYLNRGSRSIVIALLADVHLFGRASDDLVAVDGQVYLTSGSRSQGDVLTILGSIYRAQGAQNDGRLGGSIHLWDGASRGYHASLRSALVNNIRLGLAAGLALLLVGTCLTVVFPWQVVLISTTLRSSPYKSVLAGAMSLIVFVFLVVPLGLSLAGLPFALLLTAAGVLAWLFGLTSAAVVIGRLVSRRPSSLLWATSAGLLVFALGMAIPLVGALTVSAIGLAGAGALAVALIGRARPAQPYR